MIGDNYDGKLFPPDREDMVRMPAPPVPNLTGTMATLFGAPVDIASLVPVVEQRDRMRQLEQGAHGISRVAAVERSYEGLRSLWANVRSAKHDDSDQDLRKAATALAAKALGLIEAIDAKIAPCAHCGRSG